MENIHAHRDHAPKSITPSGFFGNSKDNIFEVKEIMTLEEQEKLIYFIKNNDKWDQTQTRYDEDGLVLYQADQIGRAHV